MQVHALEQKGGSILGGVLASRRQAKKAGLQKPKLAEQDVALPAVPKGQTVVSFKRGMQSLPLAMANQLKDVLRWAYTPPALLLCEGRSWAAGSCVTVRDCSRATAARWTWQAVGRACTSWVLQRWSVLCVGGEEKDLQHSRQCWHAGLAKIRTAIAVLEVSVQHSCIVRAPSPRS